VSRSPLLLLALLACGPKDVPIAALAERPTTAAAGVWQPADPVVFQLSNGANVWLMEQPGLPLFSLRLVVSGGSASDPAGQPGLTALADTMLLRGAGARDAKAFAADAEQRALALDVHTAGRVTVLSLDGHTDHLSTGLELLADAVLQPRFDKDELTLATEQRVGEVKEALDDPRSVAAMVLERTWYGPSHPLAHDVYGTEAGLAAVSAADVQASWARRSAADHSTFVVTGAVSRAEIEAALEARFATWPRSTGGPVATIPARAPAAPGQRLILVDNPGASQSVLTVAMEGRAVGDPQRVPLELGINVLGGSFTSRLNRLLREEKGYTYGARASTSTGPELGVVRISTAVRGDATGPALKDLLGEVTRIRAGIDESELTKSQGGARTDAVSAVESRAGTADTLSELVHRGYPAGALQLDLKRVASATLTETNNALAALRLDDMVVVVVGDLSKVQKEIAAAVPGTWEVVEKVAAVAP
jgi:zinc protease